MDTPARHTYTGDGTTRGFRVPTKIIGDDYVRIEIDGTYVSDRSLWDIVNNTILFIDSPVNGAIVDIQVATSQEALGLLGNITSVDTVSESIANVNIVGTNIASVNTTATNIATINTVAGSIANVNTVAGSIANVNAVTAQVIPNLAEILLADNNAAIATNKADIATAKAAEAVVSEANALSYKNTAVSSATTAVTQAGIATTQAGIATTKATEASSSALEALGSKNTAQSYMNTTEGYKTTTAGYMATTEGYKNSASTSATTATNKAAEALTSATNSATSANTATTQASNALTSANNADTSEANALTYSNNALASANAADVSEANALTYAGNALTSANNAASSLSTFNGKYVSSATEPSSPTEGMLWYDTVNNLMKVYGDSGWANAGSSVNGTSSRNTYTATAGQTTFSSTYDAGYVDVYRNGLKLSTSDFTASNGTTVVLNNACSLNDVVDIVAYGTFELADAYTKNDTDVLLAAKQQTLVSGTNIKTVNSNSLLGSGNIEITGGATGAGGDKIFVENGQVVTTNYTITTNCNAMTAGDITINSGITVTVPSGSRWSIV